MSSTQAQQAPEISKTRQVSQASQSPQTQMTTDEQRNEERKLVWHKIKKWCKLLDLKRNVIVRAYHVYCRAYKANATFNRGLRSVIAVSIFIACRVEIVYMEFALLVGKMNTPVDRTLELLWYVENEVTSRGYPDNVKVTWTPSTRSSAFSIKGKPTMEAKLQWPRIFLGTPQPPVEVVLMKDFSTKCPWLWEIRWCSQYPGPWEMRYQNGYFREVQEHEVKGK